VSLLGEAAPDTVPNREIILALRGTASFARCLNDLSDAALDGPSRIAGLSRRLIVARVGYQARLLAEAIGRLRRRDAISDISLMLRDAETSGATLPAHALRHLFEHTKVHLRVEWRDLTETDWDAEIDIGDHVAIRQTPLLRARLVWPAAVALDAGLHPADIPAEVLDRLGLDNGQPITLPSLTVGY